VASFLFETINLVSVEDIATMKIAAIIQRGRRRDFVDIYYLLDKYSWVSYENGHKKY